MEIDSGLFSQLIGTRVTEIRPGHGSFLDVFSVSEAGKQFQVWVYLAGWMLTKDNVDLLASDMNGIREFNFASVVTEDMRYCALNVIDEEELQLEFSNGVTLAIWNEPEAYGANVHLADLFIDGKFMGAAIA